MRAAFVFTLSLALLATISGPPAQAQTAGTTPGTASGQPAKPPAAPLSFNTPAGLAATLQYAETAQNSDALIVAYGQAVTNPILARAALGQLLSGYYAMRNQAQSPEQASQAVNEAALRFAVFAAAQNEVIVQQNQQLLLQNQKIINLLQEMVPKAPVAH